MLALLTPRQVEILEFIQQELRQEGRPPTLGEIGQRFGMAAPSAADHLKAIEAKGYIRRVAGERRNIRVLHPLRQKKSEGLPLLGRIAAGVPLLAQQNLEAHLNIPLSLFSPTPDFLLEVKGDSMLDAGIYPGDLVGIRSQPTAENGQVVAAMVRSEMTDEYEATLKRFRVRGHAIRLESENSRAGYPPIEFPKTELASARWNLFIAGIYCGHIHRGRQGQP